MFPVSQHEFVCITLDAGLKSKLDWQQAALKAEDATTQNKRVIWQLDFGLFNALTSPLTSQQQFLSFGLAIEHFSDFIWQKYAPITQGVNLFTGALDSLPSRFTGHFQEWITENYQNIDEHSSKDAFLKALYSRDVALDYLKQLAAKLPFGVEPYITPTLTNDWSLTQKAIFFNVEYYNPFMLNAISYSLGNQGSNVGICLPPLSHFCSHSVHLLDQQASNLLENQVNFRFIAEEALITNIAGLDELYVAESSLSPQGKRMLQGFLATGGLIHYL